MKPEVLRYMGERVGDAAVFDFSYINPKGQFSEHKGVAVALWYGKAHEVEEIGWVVDVQEVVHEGKEGEADITDISSYAANQMGLKDEVITKWAYGNR